jgi:TFIIF-interacting CTD phosphatase-like protein
MNDKNGGDEQGITRIKVAGEVLLPDDQHQLYCWKVRNGAAVQRGETIALAILKNQAQSSNKEDLTTKSTTEATSGDTIQKPSPATDMVSATSSSSAAHRRPTKRRRPGPITDATTEPATDTTASETIKTAATTSATVSNNNNNNHSRSSSTSSLDHRVPILATADGLVRMGRLTNATTTKTSYKNNPLLIGYIEACSHSTVVDSLCAVCGARVVVNKTRMAGLGGNDDEEEEANGLMSRVTVSGGITVSVSAVEGQRMALQDAERLQRLRKLSLVLDLDHTLLHATNDVRARQEALIRDDVRTLVLPMTEDNAVPNQQHQHQHQQQIMWMQHFVKLRPGVKEFLESAMTIYEIGVYTAGTRQYAEQITMILARHLVGAKRDQTDLDQLRHEVARARRQLMLVEEYNKNSNNSQSRLGQEVNNNDCRKPAAKKSKTKETLTNGNESKTTVMEMDDAAPISQPPSELTAKEGPKETDGDKATAATAVACDGDVKSSFDKNEADADELNKVAASGASNTVDGAAAALLDAEKKYLIKKIREDSTEKKDDAEIGRQSALKEDDGDKKMSAKGTGKKRKRVTFGDVPPTVKSNKPTTTTSEELEKLRAELREAELMEALAHDLKQRLFGSRIVSRTDVKDLGTDVKSLKRIFPCGGTMAVVVDDREDVWANAGDTDMVPKGEPPHNLLVVRPYHWNHFLGYADVNNASGEDLAAELDINSNKSKQYDNDQDEKQLLWTGDVLRRIHQRYYGAETASIKTAANSPVKSRLTVPELVRNMRREVLMGTKIILSGLVPLHRQQEEGGGRTSSARLRPAFVRYAENLGAVILPRVGPGLTHVVAAKDGTEKIMNARKVPGCWIVKATWLMEAAWSLKRPESCAHALGPPPKIQPQSDSSDDDDDDDDLAAELEKELIGGE